MDGQGDSAELGSGATGSNNSSTEELVAAKDSEGAVSELFQNSTPSISGTRATGNEWSASEKSASQSAHGPDVEETTPKSLALTDTNGTEFLSSMSQSASGKTDSTETSERNENVSECGPANIQGQPSFSVKENAERQDSAMKLQKLDSTPDKEGGAGKSSNASGHPESRVLTEGYGKAHISSASSRPCGASYKHKTCVDAIESPAGGSQDISEQTAALKDSRTMTEMENTMPDNIKSDGTGNASQECVPVKDIASTGSTERSVQQDLSTDTAKETVVRYVLAPNVTSEQILEALEQAYGQEKNTTPEETSNHVGIINDTATSKESSDTSAMVNGNGHHCNSADDGIKANQSSTNCVNATSHVTDSVKQQSAQQSSHEQNVDSHGSTGSKDHAVETTESSREGIAGPTEQVEGNNSEDTSENRPRLDAEASQQTKCSQDKSTEPQEEIQPTCKQASSYDKKKIADKSEDDKLSVKDDDEIDTQRRKEEAMVFSEKDMTVEDLADISEFDSTVENVAENVTLNSATEAETTESQMDSLTFETATTDGDPESSEASLEAPTSNLDLGLPVLEMPLGENGIHMYSDGDDSQQSAKKSRQEEEQTEAEISNGKDNMKDKENGAKPEGTQKENGAHVMENESACSTEGTNKSSLKLETSGKGKVCKKDQATGGEKCGASGSLNPSDQTKAVHLANKESEESIVSTVETQGCSELLKALKGNGEGIGQQGRPTVGDRHTWVMSSADQMMMSMREGMVPAEDIFEHKTETSEIMKFWRKTFQCKYCSFHAQSEADIKLHMQQKHFRREEQGRELAWIKYMMEMEKLQEKSTEQDQELLKEGETSATETTDDKTLSKEAAKNVEDEKECDKEKGEQPMSEEVPDKDEEVLATKEVTKTGRYTCTLCSYQSKSIKGLCGHMAVHSKKLHCSKCDFVGKNVTDVQKHLIKTHNISNSSTLRKRRKINLKVDEVVEKKTPKKVSGNQTLKHKARKSISPTKKNVSPTAKNVIFNNIESVPGEKQDSKVTRVFVNHKRYPHNCPHCPYTSMSMLELEAHKLFHQADKGIPCTFCSYKASDQANLMAHMQVHYAGFAYKCNHCGFLSPTQEQALQHANVVCKDKARDEPSSPTKSKARDEPSSPTKSKARDEPSSPTKSKARDEPSSPTKSKARDEPSSPTKSKARDEPSSPTKKQRTKEPAPSKGQKQKSSKSNSKASTSGTSDTSQDAAEDASDDSDIVTILQEPPKYSYKCPHCPFTVTGKAKLNLHIEGHSKEDGIKCSHCSYRATTAAKLSKHLRVHQLIGRFKCKYCRFWSVYKDRVKQHLLTECKQNAKGKERKRDVKAEQKEAGNAWVSSVDETNSDIVSMVKDPNQYHHKCPHCPFSSASPAQIDGHVARHFGQEGVQCNECTFRAISEGMLRKHRRVHQKLGKYKCKYCAYWSWYRDSVLNHLEKCKLNPGRTATSDETEEPENAAKEKTESKVRQESSPYSRWDDSDDEEIVVKVKKTLRSGHKCPHCPFVASNVGKLSIHLPNHSRSDGVKCHKCTFRASSDQLLVFHKRVHQRGVRTYHCVHCTFWSWYKDRVRSHLQKSCPNKPEDSSSSSGQKNSEKKAKKESVPKASKKHAAIDEEMYEMEGKTDTDPGEYEQSTTKDSNGALQKDTEEEELPEEGEASEQHEDIVLVEMDMEPRYGLKCPHCPLTTASSDSYQQHLARHELKEGIKCDKCSFRAMTAGRLQVHKKVHIKRYMYKCRHCTFLADSQEEVAQHLASCWQKAKQDAEVRDRKESDEVVVSRGSRQYSMNCQHCPYSTGNSKCMKAHMARHLNQDGIQCDRCSFNALSPGKMAKHMKVHQMGGGFKCKYCVFFSAYRSHVLQHLKICRDKARVMEKEAKSGDKTVTPEDVAKDLTKSSESPDNGVENEDVLSEIEVLKPELTFNSKHNCPYCPHSASSAASLEPHIQRHFVNDGPKCKFCTYRALNASGLYGHERLHWRGCFKCKHCTYIAPNRRKVFEHLKQCPSRLVLKQPSVAEDMDEEETCTLDLSMSSTNTDAESEEGKGTKRKLDRDFQIGYRKQTVKQHKCPHCPYSASGPALLEPHVVRHSDTGSGFKCDLCNYRAASFGWLNNHRKVHQDGFYFKCRYCTFWTPDRDEVLSHVANKHHAGDGGKKIKVDEPGSVETAVPSSRGIDGAGTAARAGTTGGAPSIMDTVKRLGEAISNSPIPHLLPDAKRNEDSDEVLSSPVKEALKRKEEGSSNRNLVMTLKKKKNENGEAVWQTEESKTCPYDECKKRFESASDFVTHLAGHSGATVAPNSGGQQPSTQTVQQAPMQTLQQASMKTVQQPSTKPVQQPSIPQLPPPPQPPLPAVQLPQPLLQQQAGVAPLQHPALLQQQQALLQQQQLAMLQQHPRPLNPLQLMTPNPTAPAGLVRPPQPAGNIGANQQPVLGQEQASSSPNRQVFLVSGLQQNLGGFALFVPYSSGTQSGPQAASGSVAASVAQSPQPTQPSTVAQSTAGSPSLPSPPAQPARVPSRPSSADLDFDLSQHVTQTWRGDLLCKYCSYNSQHRNVMSRHVKKHLHPSGDKGREEAHCTPGPTGNQQRPVGTPSSEIFGRSSVSPPFSSGTLSSSGTPPLTPLHFDLSKHITEDWRSGLICCNYCDFSTTAKNIMSRHVKKHLPEGMVGSRRTPDNVATPVGQQGAERHGMVEATDVMSGGIGGIFDLSKHATETWRGDYTCNHCGYVAQFKQIMSRHVKQHLQPSAGKSPKAVPKTITFQDLTLSDHIRLTMLGERTVYMCRYCDYQAAFKSHVSRHVKKHLALGVPDAPPPTETATAQPSPSVTPSTSTAQSQQHVSALPETNSSHGESPGDPNSFPSPPADSSMAGVDVEGRWWTTKFRCKHCSFSTRYKHQIEEHMRTHSPQKADQGQPLALGTTQLPAPSHNNISSPVTVHPPYSAISPPLQAIANSLSSVVGSMSASSSPSTVISPPPPAVVISPPPVPSSPLMGLPATSSATACSAQGQMSAASFGDMGGKTSISKRFVYYQCKFCQFTGSNKEDVTKHARELHPGETPPLTNQGTPYKCPLCHYSTQSSTALQVHVRRHNNREFPYLCTHCKFAGASHEDLVEHSRKHATMGRGSGRIRNLYLTIFKCPYCTFTSRVSTLMQGHLATWHATSTAFRFCVKCDLEFPNNEDMDRHMLLYHGGRATFDRYRRDSQSSTSASPAVSSEGSQFEDNEPIPLLWKASDRQAVKNMEEPHSLLSADDRKEVEQSVTQTDDSDVVFICETAGTNNTQQEQPKEQKDAASRGIVSKDVGLGSSEKAATQPRVQQESSSHRRKQRSPQMATRLPSGSGPEDDDDVMASPPSSPDLKAVTDLMEELSDSEIISEDSTDPFGQHNSSQPESSLLKASSSNVSGQSNEGTAEEKLNKDVNSEDSGRLGLKNGEQDSAAMEKGGNTARDVEKADPAGSALMVSRVPPFQSGLVGTVEQATRNSLPGQQSWPSQKSASSDFQTSSTSTHSEGAAGRGTDVGRQVKGTAVACVSVSPQTNASASGNGRSDAEGSAGTAGYRCNHCGVRFGDFLMYSIHGGFHHQENPFTCNICKHTATDRYQFNLHFTSAKHASLMDSSPMGAMAASLGVLSRGGSVPSATSAPSQPTADQGYHCIHCSMTFDDFLLYSIHSGFHSQHHPFMCNICGQDCVDRYQFVIHFAKSDHS